MAVKFTFVSGEDLRRERDRAGITQREMVKAGRKAGIKSDTPRLSTLEHRGFITPRQADWYLRLLDLAIAGIE